MAADSKGERCGLVEVMTAEVAPTLLAYNEALLGALTLALTLRVRCPSQDFECAAKVEL